MPISDLLIKHSILSNLPSTVESKQFNLRVSMSYYKIAGMKLDKARTLNSKRPPGADRSALRNARQSAVRPSL